MDRRAGGLLRVPFVRRCQIQYDDGIAADGFIVNINVRGAYVTVERLPRAGQRLTCCFGLPERTSRLTIGAAVAWLSHYQRHPVHSLPPGFGLRWAELTDQARAQIEQVVDDYVRRHPGVL